MNNKITVNTDYVHWISLVDIVVLRLWYKLCKICLFLTEVTVQATVIQWGHGQLQHLPGKVISWSFHLSLQTGWYYYYYYYGNMVMEWVIGCVVKCICANWHMLQFRVTGSPRIGLGCGYHHRLWSWLWCRCALLFWFLWSRRLRLWLWCRSFPCLACHCGSGVPASCLASRCGSSALAHRELSPNVAPESGVIFLYCALPIWPLQGFLEHRPAVVVFIPFP